MASAEEPDPLARAWARSEQQRMALDELDLQARIADLAETTPRVGLHARREELAEAVGLGATADPQGIEERARQRLGAAAVNLEEVMSAERNAAAEAREPDAADPDVARRELSAVRSARKHVEAEAADAWAEAEATEAALARQAVARKRTGSDLRGALEELEVVDSALATCRRRGLAALSSAPPAYVVDLLGSPPAEASRALRWQQGLTEIEDWRRWARVCPDPTAPGAWVRALGPPAEGFAARRYRRVVDSLRVVRRDLGLELDSLPAASMTAGSRGDAGRAAPAPSRHGRSHELAPPPCEPGWGRAP